MASLPICIVISVAITVIFHRVVQGNQEIISNVDCTELTKKHSPCRADHDSVKCFCKSRGDFISIYCKNYYYEFYDGRTGEAICPRQCNSKQHDNCLADDFKSYFQLDVTDAVLTCEQVMRKGCVTSMSASACFCESSGQQITLQKSWGSDHLNIYDGHTGELLCQGFPLVESKISNVCEYLDRKIEPFSANAPATLITMHKLNAVARNGSQATVSNQSLAKGAQELDWKLLAVLMLISAMVLQCCVIVIFFAMLIGTKR